MGRNLIKSYSAITSHTRFSEINCLRSSFWEHPKLITNLMECGGKHFSDQSESILAFIYLRFSDERAKEWWQ